MKRFVVPLMLLLAAPAAAQQCAPLPGFAAKMVEQGYEFFASAKDGDGDQNFILWNPKDKTWLIVFVPGAAPHLVCLMAAGDEFEPSVKKGGSI